MGKFGFSWSWRRASGISALKGRVSRKIGVPLTRSGRERKVGSLIGGWLALAPLIGSSARSQSASPPPLPVNGQPRQRTTAAGTILGLFILVVICWGGCVGISHLASAIVDAPRSAAPYQQRSESLPGARKKLDLAIDRTPQTHEPSGQPHPSFETRIWTLESGRTIEAKLVKSGGGKATLEVEGEGRIVVRIDDLSDEDRAWIHKAALKR